MSRIALGVCILIVIISSGQFMREKARNVDVDIALAQPSATHLLGTDVYGRDVFARLIVASAQTLLSTSIATSIAVLTGCLLSFIAEFLQPTFSTLARIAILAAIGIPSLILSFLIVSFLGIGQGQLIIAVGISQCASMAEITKSAYRTALVEPHTTASYALGGTELHIFLQHIWPASQTVIKSYSFVLFQQCLVSLTALTIIGLGDINELPDLGVMFAEGRGYLLTAPWVTIAPAATTLALMAAIDAVIRISSKGITSHSH